jgi:hypothetical protein
MSRVEVWCKILVKTRPIWSYDKNRGISRTRQAYITEAIISMTRSYLCYYTFLTGTIIIRPTCNNVKGISWAYVFINAYLFWQVEGWGNRYRHTAGYLSIINFKSRPMIYFIESLPSLNRSNGWTTSMFQILLKALARSGLREQQILTCYVA